MKPILLAILVLPAALWASATFPGPSVTGLELAATVPNGAPRPVLGLSHAPAVPTRYAIVDRAALVDITATVRRTLSRTYGIGVGIVSTGWDPRFDCEAFALAWQLELRARLMREWFHSDATTVTRPAAFMICILRGRAGHALISVLTTEGPVIIDPVVGPVNLTPDEVASIYYLNL